jgi:hypothetical protein
MHALSGIRTRDPVYERSRPAPQTARPLDLHLPTYLPKYLELTPCWRIFLEELIVIQLVEKLTIFMALEIHHRVHKTHQWIPSYAVISTQFTFSKLTIQFNISFCLVPDLQSGFLQVFKPKYGILFSFRDKLYSSTLLQYLGTLKI